MYQMTLDTIGLLTGCATFGNHAVMPQSVAIDSRAVAPGGLFVALRGERTDGHRYIEAALKNGAVAVAVSDESALSQLPSEIGALLVEDGAAFLQTLATALRSKFTGPVIAITGSQGKTSTKDLLAEVLAPHFNLVVTAENQNNELGMPLTITRLEEGTEVLIVEMGMTGFGEIDFLAQMARPTHGIITAVGIVHAELLGSQEGVAKAKAELIPYLPAEGLLAIRDGDAALLAPYLKGNQAALVRCSHNTAGDCYATDIVLDTASVAFTMHGLFEAPLAVQVPFPGMHTVDNALLVMAVAASLGLSAEAVADGLRTAKRRSANRMAYVSLPGERLLINDCYNANPASMMATLDVLGQYRPRQTIACLGDMYELGIYEQSGHAEVGTRVRHNHIDGLITVGSLAANIADAAEDAGMQADAVVRCADNACAVRALRAMMQEDTVVLIKGSHSVGMEVIAEQLLAETEEEDPCA